MVTGWHEHTTTSKQHTCVRLVLHIAVNTHRHRASLRVHVLLHTPNSSLIKHNPLSSERKQRTCASLAERLFCKLLQTLTDTVPGHETLYVPLLKCTRPQLMSLIEQSPLL